MRPALILAPMLAPWLAATGPATAQSSTPTQLPPAVAPAAPGWTDAIFPERTHDFGTVARGSKVRHSFQLVNSTGQEIHIESWKAGCGCTEPRVGARTIPPGTQTVIEIVLDTTKFVDYKQTGLTVRFDRPAAAQVELGMTCFIRSDITLNPGQVDFGIVNRSTGPKVDLVLNYNGGQAGWEVTKINTVGPHIVAELRKQAGAANGYVLTTKLLPTAPIGFFKDEITLITNDPKSPKIPVSVAAVVQSNVTASPSVINLGKVRPGESVQKSILVRSAQPFRITGVEVSKADISAAPMPEGAKATHAVNFTFKAPAQAGPFNATVEVQADLKDEPPARVTVFATVVP